ncbi:MAG: class I SAM-dependent methyltransferase [Pseudomonadales bacterium]|nr:class I SAM-dependent methyltransferase [Pseudomonadales bacterium]
MNAVASDEQNRAAAYWSRLARKYAARPVRDESAYQYKLARTREYLSAESRVLEFGCGTGATALLHAPLVREYLAIDVAPAMIEIAQERQREQPVSSLSFRTGALDDEGLADQHFDVVLGLNVLHLIKDVDQALEQVHRLLKPGGIFIGSTAVLKDTMPWLPLIAVPGYWLRRLPRIIMLSSDGLTDSLQQRGFETLERWQADSAREVLFHVSRKT